jgi:AcrR family transcriptional regulator
VDLKTRRRGEELETAILDAAWEQLVDKGYSEFTFEAIAARAGTSRTVLYRRWSDRSELLQATIRHIGAGGPIELPDTGSLRDDVIGVLSRMSDARAGFVAALTAHLGAYFAETGTSLNDLRDLMRRGPRSGMQIILERAAERGEVDITGLPTRVVDLPVTLARNEMLMTLKPVPRETITEIVDEVWLPLLRARGALPVPEP